MKILTEMKRNSGVLLEEGEISQEKQLNAGQVVRELGKLIHGGGGGQPFFATAGGRNPKGIEKALSESKRYIV